MEKELLNSDKELLLKDLCARLPYGVMCATTDNDGSLPNIWEIVKADMLNEDFFLIHDSYEASRTVDVKEVRPYLFPLSSMTKEQKKEYDDNLTYHDYTRGGWAMVKDDDEYIIPYWFVDFCIAVVYIFNTVWAR